MTTATNYSTRDLKPAAEASSIIGKKVTHPNAPERAGTVRSVKAGIAQVEYVHTDELGGTFSTFGEYNVAELIPV